MQRKLPEMKNMFIAQKCWSFISSHLIDRDKGEWFWSIKSDGVINRIDDKADFGNVRITMDGCVWK